MCLVVVNTVRYWFGAFGLEMFDWFTALILVLNDYTGKSITLIKIFDLIIKISFKVFKCQQNLFG